jgi:DNA-binding SARP family transcriptional activator/tetratricopeptide (TPR) repeat protein
VVTEDGPVRLPGRRERTVLAVLLVNHDRVVPRDYLVEAVWDTAPPATAKRQVQNSVSTIRRFLVRGGAPADTLVGEDSGYRFRSRPGSLDVQEFHDRTAAALQLVGDGRLERAAVVLRSALDLWRGPALLGLTGRVVESAAAELEEQRLVAVEQRVDLDLRLGRHHDLVAELTTLTSAYPLRERFGGQLMLALHRSGRQAEAVAAFHRIRARLNEELGLAPGAALQERYAEILHGTGPAQAGVPVTDTPPAQLPPDVPGFTGRATHLAQLDDQPALALWVITGMAGVGKTALAVHWGHRVRDRFPDGQLYVNLRGFAGGTPVTPVEALAHLLYALGTANDRIPVDVDRAVGRYRSLLSGRRVLVILDDAADVEQVRPLLPGEPGCVVLVTSRIRLAGLVAVDGARHLPLDVLTDGEAQSLLSRILGQERVSAEPRATAALVRQCSRLPLALRIAAANLARFPDIDSLVTVLAARDGLSGLEIEGDDRGGVRRTFDLSYQALAQDARRLFRVFGQVPCVDLTAEVAAALTGATPPEATRLLDRLAAAHLVHQHVPGRFACHDLLRQYAEDLGSGEAPAEIVCALDAWYLARADRAAAVLYPHRVRLRTGSAGAEPVDEVAALAWLDAERANLVAVVRHAADYGPRPTSWLLADTLRGYFWLRMHTVDWSQTAHAALRAAETAGDDHGQAAALLSIGDLHYRRTEHRQAARDYERALALSRRAGWVDGEVAALGNLGILHQQAGRVRQAAEHYAEVLTRCGAGGSASVRTITVPNALACLGLAHLELGRLTTAAEHARQALDLYGELGWRAGEATVRTDLGRISRAAGHLTEAAEHFTRALALARELGDRGIESAALCGLATVHLDTGEADEAADYADAALALAQETGDRRFEAEALNVMGALHHRHGQAGDAQASHTRALHLTRTAGEPYLEAESLLYLATLHADLDQTTTAADHARNALAVADQHGFELLGRHAHTILGMVNA